MAQIKSAYLERALMRGMRPDSHLSVNPNWRRFVPSGSEIATVYERYERKYRPDQARVPAGSSEGGQWTGGGVGSSGSVNLSAILAGAKKLAGIGGLNYRRCLDLCYPLLERFSRPGSDRNTFDFHKCMNICLGK